MQYLLPFLLDHKGRKCKIQVGHATYRIPQPAAISRRWKEPFSQEEDLWFLSGKCVLGSSWLRVWRRDEVPPCARGEHPAEWGREEGRQGQQQLQRRDHIQVRLASTKKFKSTKIQCHADNNFDYWTRMQRTTEQSHQLIYKAAGSYGVNSLYSWSGLEIGNVITAKITGENT